MGKKLKEITIDEKLREILSRIEMYSYVSNIIYLAPLYDDLNCLRKCFSRNSKNDTFNDYIKQKLLPGIESYEGICKNGPLSTSLKFIEGDIQIIKRGILYSEFLFRAACEKFSVSSLNEPYSEI